MSTSSVDQPEPTNDPAAGLLLTLNRGIQVLEQVARDRGRATAKSLVTDLGINLGTCYQILRTLQANGYLHRLPGGRYTLGTRVGMLADQYDSTAAPPPELMDTLHDLHQALKETVYISIRRNRGFPIVGVLEGVRILRVGNLTVGYSGHANVRASAKAFLAYAPVEALDDFFDSRTFQPLTPNTITTWEQFLDELGATRARGYGVDREEYTSGVSCIGAAIFAEDGQPYGAYGTSLPTSRFLSDEAMIARHVMAAAERASRHMGYRGPYPPLPTEVRT
ncbi:MAG TPA: IclR family transcriptional regulator [Acidimicrobiia bacterium]|nr:IclR family transcriptional regulator [Acidimicrobiia bacterium]